MKFVSNLTMGPFFSKIVFEALKVWVSFTKPNKHLSRFACGYDSCQAIIQNGPQKSIPFIIHAERGRGRNEIIRELDRVSDLDSLLQFQLKNTTGDPRKPQMENARPKKDNIIAQFIRLFLIRCRPSIPGKFEFR